MSVAEANLASAELRRARAAVKTAVRSGQIPLREVLLDPPVVMRGMRVFEVMELHVGLGKEARRTALRRLNMLAAYEGVNLMSDFGAISPRQREWLAEQLPSLRGAGGRMRLPRARVA